VFTASSTPTSTLTWISWFCSLPGHEYFCEVAEEFIEDDFNLTGLNAMVPFFKEALEMVLDVETGDDAAHIFSTTRSHLSPQMRTRPRFRTSRSWRPLLKSCTAWFINVTSLLDRDSRRWSGIYSDSIYYILTPSTAPGRQVRGRHVRLLSTRILRWYQRRPLWTIRCTGCGHREALLP
jgi:hypothetical protein